MEVRGRYCSPECLENARAANRLPDGMADDVADTVIAVNS
jgi:hypothetical protein